MQHTIIRIDTSLIPPETCQCFFIFLQDTLTRLYKKNTGFAGVYYFTRRPHGIKSRVE